jgi:hypothetical protein
MGMLLLCQYQRREQGRLWGMRRGTCDRGSRGLHRPSIYAHVSAAQSKHREANDLRGVEDVTANTTRASLGRESLGIQTIKVSTTTSRELLDYLRSVLARRSIISAEVGGVVASETRLRLFVL